MFNLRIENQIPGMSPRLPGTEQPRSLDKNNGWALWCRGSEGRQRLQFQSVPLWARATCLLTQGGPVLISVPVPWLECCSSSLLNSENQSATGIESTGLHLQRNFDGTYFPHAPIDFNFPNICYF